MKVFGASESDVRDVVEHISRTRYAGNLTIRDSRDLSNSRGGRAQFTLRVRDSHGVGARKAISGHYSIGACWCAHWDVLAELFNRYPDARVSTAFYTATRENFAVNARASQDRNVGSRIEPKAFGDLCACEDTGRELLPLLTPAGAQ